MSAHEHALRRHEQALVHAGLHLPHDRGDVRLVHRLLVQDAVAIEDELPVEQDERLEAVQRHLLYGIRGAAGAQEALHPVLAQLPQSHEGGLRHAMRRERDHGSVRVEERSLDVLVDLPL